MMQNLKVCHISTFQGGGAGTAAFRLHKGLLLEGCDSKFICAYPKGEGASVITVPYDAGLLKKGLKKLHLYNDRVTIEQIKIARSGGKFEYYSTPFSNYPLETLSAIRNCDIIHLHWVADIVNYPTFFSGVKVPIVWTLHDMNPLMGGFHYQEDYNENKGNNRLLQIEEHYSAIKTKAITAYSSINIVSPSTWLYDMSLASKLGKLYPHAVIPYGLDVEVFKRSDKDFSRNLFNLPTEKKMLLFISENLNNKRKGFDLLLKSLSMFTNTDNFFVVAVGDTVNEYNIPNLYTLDRIKEERLLSVLYSAADAFIIPSREDNLPNVMLEALTCGTPVIGFPIGGVKDTIEDGINGLLCETVSAEALHTTIDHFLNMPDFDHKAIREKSIRTYSLKKQATEYIKLYSEII